MLSAGVLDWTLDLLDPHLGLLRPQKIHKLCKNVKSKNSGLRICRIYKQQAKDHYEGN
jgi:hypothetical protein